MSEIVMIPGSDLYEHPDNPRKVLGDLSELTQSIARNGILQNLTVVPGHWRSKDTFIKDAMAEGMTKSDAAAAYSREMAFTPFGYTVVIGHRRRAAGLAAGLKEFPCVVSYMDERQQFLTMLEENMQRTDLTIPEQAYGFQMMFNWGESIKDIADKSGFSEQTVKHRLEIARLDPKIMKSVEEKDLQLTINDYRLLEKIKDVKRREALLSNLSSRETFASRVEHEARAEMIDTKMAELMPLLEAHGVKQGKKNGYLRWTAGYEKIRQIDLEKPIPKKLTLPSDVKLFWERDYSTIYILKYDLDGQKAKAAEEQKKQKEIEKIRDQLREKIEHMCDDIKRFISLIYEGKITSSRSEEDTLQTIWKLWKDCFGTLYASSAYEITGKNRYSQDDNEKKEFMEKVDKLPVSSQLLIMMRAEIYSNRFQVTDYKGEIIEEAGQRLTRIHDDLADLFGFEWSDPEFAQIADGTHELYRRLENGQVN